MNGPCAHAPCWGEAYKQGQLPGANHMTGRGGGLAAVEPVSARQPVAHKPSRQALVSHCASHCGDSLTGVGFSLPGFSAVWTAAGCKCCCIINKNNPNPVLELDGCLVTMI
ncbi:unnamed protein product [Eretmochelys imbricata]